MLTFFKTKDILGYNAFLSVYRRFGGINLTTASHAGPRNLLAWLVYFSLGLSVVYTIFYVSRYFGNLSGNGSFVSGPWDLLTWSIGLFIIFGWFFLDVLNGVLSDTYLISTSLILCLGLVALFACVCFVLAGSLSVGFLSLISLLSIFISFTFSSNVFGLSRRNMLWRVTLGIILAALFVGLALLAL